MDGAGNQWYYSCMTLHQDIPVFTLFGETGSFPDVVHCERIRDRASQHDWVITPHRHGQMVQLLHLERGRAEARIDGRAMTLKAGQFVYVPLQAVHGFKFARGAEGTVLSFPLPVLRSLGPVSADLNDSLSAPFLENLPEAAERLIADLSSLFAGTGTYRAQTLVALSHAILAIIAGCAPALDGTAASGARHMQRFTELIGQHMTDGWRVADYASAMSITSGQLSRICRAATGGGAARHLDEVVMAEASRLLAFTRLPVAEIGYRLGYTDPPYFSRRFRKVRGETPSAYRARFMQDS